MGPVSEDGVIEVSTPCRHCEYDLLGLTERDACSECGLPVAESLSEYSLFRASAGYVRTLRRASLALLIVVPASIAAVIAAIFLQSIHLLSVGLLAGVHAAGGIAWSYLGGAHPDRPRASGIEIARRRLRLAAHLSLAPIVLGVLLAVIPATRGVWVESANAAIWAIALGVRTRLAIVYARRFSIAVPATRAARRFRPAGLWMTLCACAGGVVLLLGAASAIGNRTGNATLSAIGDLAMFANCMLVPTGIALLIVFVIYHIRSIESLHEALAHVERAQASRAEPASSTAAHP